MKPKTILITGKDAFVGAVITKAIEKKHMGTIYGYCSRGPEAFNCIQEMHPNFIILDLFLPGMGGLPMLKKIRTKKYEPIVLGYCRCLNKMYGVKCAKAGATALIDYSCDIEQAYDCLERVSWGQKIYPQEIWDLLNSNDYEKYIQKYTDVTLRQSEVLELAALNYSNQEISKMLHIAVKTVEKHKHTVKTKYGLRSASELVHFAIRNGIIEREETVCT